MHWNKDRRVILGNQTLSVAQLNLYFLWLNFVTSRVVIFLHKVIVNNVSNLDVTDSQFYDNQDNNDQ